MTVSQDDATDGGQPRLRVANLSKSFGAARVLRGVELAITPGELHGLVGQNGCGKSTLVKILTGVYTPDPGGSVTVDGRALPLPVRPLDARAAGLSVVHQNLGLVDDRSIWENVRLGRYQAGRLSRRINVREEKRQVAQALARLDLALDVDTRVGELAAEDRAAVAIARAIQDFSGWATPRTPRGVSDAALSRGTPPDPQPRISDTRHTAAGGLIIFDESTRALTRRGRARFFHLVRSVIDGGASVLLISHQLEEVVQATDRVTVLRDGQVVEGGISTKETDEAGLTRLMLGRHVVTHSRVGSQARGGPAARVRGLAVRSVSGLDLDLRKGEIVGFTGLVGSGAVAAAEAIGGARQARAGVLTVGGRDLHLSRKRGCTEDFIKAGVAFVAERRLEQGLAGELSVTENLTLPRVRGRGSVLRTGGKWQAQETAAMIAKLDIRPPDPDALVGNLSGGNQQKVLLGKWMVGQPDLLVLHEPTQAVDVGARHDIIDAVREAAREGCGVIVSSVDAADLAVLCDRVLIFRDGRVAAELSGEMTADDIIHATFEAPGAERPADELRREAHHHNEFTRKGVDR